METMTGEWSPPATDAYRNVRMKYFVTWGCRGKRSSRTIFAFRRPHAREVRAWTARRRQGGGDPRRAMPIRPDLLPLYPPHWRELSRHVRFERAEGRCQRCGRPHLPDGRWFDEQAATWRDRRGRPARWPDLMETARFRKTRVVLAAAHLSRKGEVAGEARASARLTTNDGVKLGSTTCDMSATALRARQPLQPGARRCG